MSHSSTGHKVILLSCSSTGLKVSLLCLVPPWAIRSACYVLFLGHKVSLLCFVPPWATRSLIYLLCLILPLSIMSICCMFYSFTVCQVMCLFVMLPHWHHDFLSFKLPSSWENKGQESHVCHRWNN